MTELDGVQFALEAPRPKVQTLVVWREKSIF